MRKLSFACTVLSLFLIAGFTACAQQDKSTRPSPPATATVDFGGGKFLTINYSSPRVKGRKIFGDVVPYGKVWRTGANESTTFVTNVDLNLAGTMVPAGNYTLFTIPDKDRWTLILSKKTGEWGTNYPGPSEDLARIDMTVSTPPALTENFTISLDKTPTGATLNIDWENTRASVGIGKR
jgi:Protein of unknown function (DUF2911)